MRKPLPINDLEIVGYANRLRETMLPAVVPPIFREKANRTTVFLPPYVIQEGFVCSAIEKTTDDLPQLDEAGEATLFKPAFEARRDHELWIAEDGVAHYEPIPIAEAALREIAVINIAAAVAALERDDIPGARKHCRTAICADDRFVEPLAMSAAIARLERDGATERLMAKLAEKRTTSDGFEMLVKCYRNKATAPVAEPLPDLLSTHNMCGIAARKAA